MIYLHIGASKTGSTLIQSVLQQNKDVLKNQYQTLYFDHSNSHVTNLNDLIDLIKYEYINGLNLIHSDELISVIFKDKIEQVPNFLDQLSSIDNIKIIFYERDKQDAYKSAYKTLIMNCLPEDADPYRILVDSLDLQSIIDFQWKIVKYQKGLDDRLFIQQFLGLCDITDFNPILNNIDHNRIPSDEFIDLISSLNNYVKKFLVNQEIQGEYLVYINLLREYFEEGGAW